MTDEPTPANDARRRAWDGPTGGYWAEHADHYDRGVAAHRDAFLTAAGAGPADRRTGCWLVTATRGTAGP